MDKVLHDILNAGIALFRAGEDSLNNAVKEVQRTFEQLKSKGAADQSEPAVKMRKTLDDVVTQVNGLSGKAGGAYNEAIVKLEGLYKQVADQATKMVPQDQVNQIKDKVDELTRVIKEKADQVRGKK
ncbi:MAG: hypothetical protein HY042_10325 [Spirochaetia bacterium]|nr:hypothetical protein [Spirochaetia bacterium]